MIDGLLSIVAPHYCYGCGVQGVILCDCCKNYVYDEPFSGCVLCSGLSKDDNLCSGHTLPYQRLWCVTKREGTVAKVIDAYKFERVGSAHRVLADLVNDSLPDIQGELVIVPIPTAPKNIRIRGYDHMLLVAKRLSKLRGWPVKQLLRRRNNITQHFAKSATERKRQAKEFFEVSGKIDKNLTHLVIDDIFTTGSTVEAAAECLKRAGAENVYISVISRQ